MFWNKSTTVRSNIAFLVIIFAAILLESEGEKSVSRYRGRSHHSCYNAWATLEKVYKKHVEMIRRGMPTLVAQGEYVWAINRIAEKERDFRTHNLRKYCLTTFETVFTRDTYEARYALTFMREVKNWRKSVDYLWPGSFGKLPPMTGKQKELVKQLWARTSHSLEIASKRGYYKLKDMPFPENVQILHDPFRAKACKQYYKYGKVTESNSMQAKRFMISLFISVMKLRGMGAWSYHLKALLEHAVAFIFNGIRCIDPMKEKKGDDPEYVGVPIPLILAYAHHMGYIQGTIYRRRRAPIISYSKAEQFFEYYLKELVEYSSWGQLRYAKMNMKSNAYPVVVDGLRIILSPYTRRRVQGWSVQEEISDKVRIGVFQNATSKQSTICHQDYELVERQELVWYESQKCCGRICFDIAKILPSSAGYSLDVCCERCNEFNGCPGKLGTIDMVNSAMSKVVVPEYGEQEQREYVLVVLL